MISFILTSTVFSYCFQEIQKVNVKEIKCCVDAAIDLYKLLLNRKECRI